MESNFLTAVFLPLALFIIMLGMGLGLKLDDFKRVFVEPKGAIVGLIAHGLLLKERANVLSFFLQVGWVTLTLNLLTMVLGYAIANFAELDKRSATAITFEVGIQNGTLAIAIASGSTFLNNPTMAIPAAIYSLLMFGTGGAFAWWSQRRSVMSVN